LLSILDWVAICFVTDPIGDAVATALSIEDDQITFYVATHRSQTRPEDRENGANFIQLLRDVIGQTDVSKITGQIMITLAPRFYSRFTRKIDMIRMMERGDNNGPSEPVEVRFNRILDRWAAAGNMEGSTYFLEESLYHGALEEENGNQRLKTVMKFMASELHHDANTTPKDDEERRSWIITLSLIAFALIKSDFILNFFMTTSGNPIPRLDSDFQWILQLRRRLMRVSCYYNDASVLAADGLPFFRRILGPDGVESGGPGIQIVWINDQPGVLPNSAVVLKKSPETYLNGLFMDCSYGRDDRPFPVIPPENKNHLENLWHADETISIHLHCEIRLITYLEENGIRIKGCHIGNSKLMCTGCNTYIARVNEKRALIFQWVLSGTSCKPHHRWILPRNPVGEKVVRDLKKKLFDLLDQLEPIPTTAVDEHVDNLRPAYDLQSYISRYTSK
jgi:hypothetical protein